MTAEVVVMNRGGVALATDSAVTVRAGDRSRVRDSAVKLFRLSNHYPVGVMVYENSSLLGVPWETIIKMYREELGTEKRASLPEYGRDLVEFLDGNGTLFPDDVQDRYFQQAVEAEFSEIARTARRELADSRIHAIGDKRAGRRSDVRWVEDEIRRSAGFWRKKKRADYFKSVSGREVAGRNSGGVNELINRIFGNWEIGSPDRQRLLRIAEHLVEKDHIPGHTRSGIVIAGFGEEEHFPSVQHMEVGGMYGGVPKVLAHPVKQVSEESPSHVIPFAYTEMVDSFLEGISERAFIHLRNAAAFIREMPVAALDVVPGLDDEEKARLTEVVREASDRKADEFGRSVLKRSIARSAEISAAVEALTIKELAQVASTLVSLSSFQQQMSLGQQTVGGPVDVAVISKGDGFIWIDRKQYFQPELNNHFFQNYYGMQGRRRNAE